MEGGCHLLSTSLLGQVLLPGFLDAGLGVQDAGPWAIQVTPLQALFVVLHVQLSEHLGSQSLLVCHTEGPTLHLPQDFCSQCDCFLNLCRVHFWGFNGITKCGLPQLHRFGRSRVENLLALSLVLLLLEMGSLIALGQGFHQGWIWGVGHNLVPQLDAEWLGNLVSKRSLSGVHAGWRRLGQIWNVHHGRLLLFLGHTLSLPVVGAVCLEAKLPEFAIHQHARHRLSVVDRILRGLAEETLLLLGVPGCQAGGAHHLHGCTCIHLMHLAIAKAPLLRWLQELPSQQLAMLFGSLDNDVALKCPLHTSTGQGLATEDIEQLGYFLYWKSTK